MINKLTSLLFILFILNFFILQGQNTDKVFKADSVFIYKIFKNWGTTANLRHYHRMLDSTNAIKTKISIDDLNELKTIVNNAKRKKLFQQKYGGETFYLVVYNKGYKRRFVAGAGTKIEIFDDLDEMKRWIIKDSIDIDKFTKLLKKNTQ